MIYKGTTCVLICAQPEKKTRGKADNIVRTNAESFPLLILHLFSFYFLPLREKECRYYMVNIHVLYLFFIHRQPGYHDALLWFCTSAHAH